MNGSFLFVLSIILIVMGARLIETWIKQRRSESVPNDEVEEALAKIERLEERVKVLERIVTENRIDLRQQIDNL